jgi:tRNA A-37 threonylcarbamoyl transferase component Bud32
VSSTQHSRAKTIFLEAVELTGDQRLSYLAEACGSDQALRREVESLLRHHTANTLLSGNLRAATSTLPLDSTPQDTPHRRWLETGRVTAALLGNRRRRLLSILAAVLLLVATGFWTREKIKQAMRRTTGQHLQALLDADVLALEEWIEQGRSDALAWASDARVREAVEQLVATTRTRKVGGGEWSGSEAQRVLRELLNPYLQEDDASGYLLTDLTGLVLASSRPEDVGQRLQHAQAPRIDRVMAGETLFIRPLPEAFEELEPEGADSDRPTAWMATPVRDADEHVMAVLGFGTFADQRFNDILTVAQMGESGETCAFNHEGLMLSESRFTEKLKEIGLVPNQENARSMLQVQMRDPGGDLTQGHKPLLEVAARPLTMSAALAIASRNKKQEHQRRGMIVEAYRDYRGVRVLGAWRWLEEYDFGMTTKVNVAEADAPLVYLEAILGVLILLFAGSITFGLLSSFAVARLRKQVDEAIQIGQYQLESLIGEGGMGRVYLARHAMLKRPTAVKIIRSELTNSKSIARFEREVQLASRLTHPNTIEIYDFGRTAEGIFYYAMEYLPGINLAGLIQRAKIVPPERVVHILKQVCGSLSEAHAKGLVHRDIKPQNITLCERGGVYDVVKVLDFGLVVDVNQPLSTRLTSHMQIMGTPLFMAPEQLRDPRRVDPRSDIYSLGAVAYHLLTGKPPYAESATRLQVIEAVLNEEPRPLSSVTQSPIPTALENLVMRCLSKDLDQRHQSIEELLTELNRLAGIPEWTAADAIQWWRSFAEEEAPSEPAHA